MQLAHKSRVCEKLNENQGQVAYPLAANRERERFIRMEYPKWMTLGAMYVNIISYDFSQKKKKKLKNQTIGK